MAVILAPYPAFGRHIRRRHEFREGFAQMLGLADLGRVDLSARFSRVVRAIIFRRVLADGIERQVANDFALMV